MQCVNLMEGGWLPSIFRSAASKIMETGLSWYMLSDMTIYCFTGHCVGAGCGWSCRTVRSVAAPVALPPRGAGVLETETTTGVEARLPGEGDPHVII